jgi:hypothetical protein
VLNLGPQRSRTTESHGCAGSGRSRRQSQRKRSLERREPSEARCGVSLARRVPSAPHGSHRSQLQVSARVQRLRLRRSPRRRAGMLPHLPQGQSLRKLLHQPKQDLPQGARLCVRRLSGARGFGAPAVSPPASLRSIESPLREERAFFIWTRTHRTLPPFGERLLGVTLSVHFVLEHAGHGVQPRPRR